SVSWFCAQCRCAWDCSIDPAGNAIFLSRIFLSAKAFVAWPLLAILATCVIHSPHAALRFSQTRFGSLCRDELSEVREGLPGLALLASESVCERRAHPGTDVPSSPGCSELSGDLCGVSSATAARRAAAKERRPLRSRSGVGDALYQRLALSAGGLARG